MSDHAPCSCRIAWLTAAACAFAAGAALALPHSAAVPRSADPSATPPAPASAPVAVDARLDEARLEAEELRRVLNDAHSAMAQRDREIAAAEDELRTLRKELETLRTRPGPSP